MKEAFNFILAVLATYRVARMVTQEEGAFEVFTKLRTAIKEDTWVKRGFNCFFCVSFYLGLLSALATKPQNLIDWLLKGLAASGAACLLFRRIG